MKSMQVQENTFSTTQIQNKPLLQLPTTAITMDHTTLTIVHILISILNLCNAQLLILQTYHQENLQHRLSHAPSKKQMTSLVVASKLQKDLLNNPWRNLQDEALHLSPQQSGITGANNFH
jgi:hypothetical protein